MSRRSVGMAIAAGLLLGALFAKASTFGAPVSSVGWVVNDSSFAPEGMEGPASRIVQFGTHIWDGRTGGSSTHQPMVGIDNMLSGCVPGNPNHIWGAPGCYDFDFGSCTTLAYHQYWACGGAHEIKFFLGAANFRMLPTTNPLTPPLTINFANTVEHELGHTFMDHLTADPSNPCLMDPVTNGTNSSATLDNACPREIEFMAGAASHPRDAVFLTQTSSFPIPNGSWGIKTQVAARYGNAFGSAVRGRVGGLPGVNRDTFFFLDNTVDPHTVRMCDYSFGAGNCSVQATGLNYAKGPPTVAFDPTRNKWWFFGHGLLDDHSIMVSSTVDRVTFTSLGFVNAAGTTIQTKNPVAAAYDPKNDRIVVAYARSNGLTVPPCGSGCVHDTNLVSFPAGAIGTPSWSGLVSWPRAGTFGNSGQGAPALACDNSSAANCMIVVNGRDANRGLWSWSFSMNSSGALAIANAPEQIHIAATDMTPSLTSSSVLTSNSAFVVAVRGTDGQVYINSKTNLGASGWAGFVGVVSAGSPLMTTSAPVIAVRSGSSTYDLLVSP